MSDESAGRPTSAAVADVRRLWSNLQESVGKAMVGANEPLRLLTAALLEIGRAHV